MPSGSCSLSKVYFGLALASLAGGSAQVGSAKINGRQARRAKQRRMRRPSEKARWKQCYLADDQNASHSHAIVVQAARLHASVHRSMLPLLTCNWRCRAGEPPALRLQDGKTHGAE